jgi:hypothetical protein
MFDNHGYHATNLIFLTFKNGLARQGSKHQDLTRRFFLWKTENQTTKPASKIVYRIYVWVKYIKYF